jgi:prepilin-type N-terminal cleavage/methylation domain-containing protein
MYFRQNDNARSGFTLFELLIVIFIVSIVYFMGFEGIQINKPKPKALTPLTLKSTITASDFFPGEGTFMCIDKCRSCYFRSDITSAFESYPNAVDLGELEVYTLDAQDALVELEYGRYQDEKICLLVDFYPNGSSTQLILKDKINSYFLPAYFDEPQRFASIEEAKDFWLRNTTLVSDNGAFY